MTDKTSSLDSFDRRLLRIVQRDNRRTHADMGCELGLSASAVRRRLDRLRRDGVIIRDISLLSPPSLGETVIISVRMEVESRASYAAISKRLLEAPEVMQCYTICGEADFIIIGHFKDLGYYDDWAKTVLMEDDNVARYTSYVVSNRVKFDMAIPIGER